MKSGQAAQRKPGERAAAAGQPVRKSSGKKRLRNKKKALRRKRIRLAAVGMAVIAAVSAAAFFLTAAVIDGQIYPKSTQTVDLRCRGLTDARGVARLTGLQEALLSGNEIADASPLSSLTECDFIDLTDNPVSRDSYQQLRRALPDCVILCEAGDDTTAELMLGGYDLPDVQALADVFAAHSALKTVDLRGTGLTREAADALREQFGQIRFVYSAQTEGTQVLRLSGAQEAAEALNGVSGSHATLTGCVFTMEEYRALQERFPQTAIDCLLRLGGEITSSGAEEIDLRNLPELTAEEGMKLFPNLKRLTIGESVPTAAAKLKETFGLDELSYVYNGCVVSAETEEIDLRGAAELDADEMRALLNATPRIQTVRMETPDEAMDSVIRERAGVHFIYEVNAFGKTFSTADESIDLGGAVSEEDVEALEDLLARMPNLKEALMYESKLSQESMDRLFDGHPEVFFGWTFKMCDGRYTVRSDATAFSTQLGKPRNVYTQENFEQLRYCKNLQGLDLGHNAITDVDFLYNFPKMKVLILADNRITDITPMASLTELEYLELFMNYELTDFSPLINLEHLIDLNVRCEQDKRHTLEIDAFLEMKSLERLWISSGHFTDDEEEQLEKALPDCKISITDSHSTGNGWRKTERYEVVERMFEKGRYEPFR